MAISAVALIVAIGSLYISCQTKNIYDIQADMLEKQANVLQEQTNISESINRPFIVSRLEYNNDNASQPGTSVNFANMVGSFCNASVEQYSCICIQGSINEGQESNVVYMPISPYYVMEKYSRGNADAILVHLDPGANDIVFHELGNELENQLGKIGHDVTYLSPNVITLVKLKYESIFGQSFIEYWEINKQSPHSYDIYVDKLLDEDSYATAIDKYSTEMPIFGESQYFLSSLDASTIIDYWTSYTFNISNTQATNNQSGNCAPDCPDSYIGDDYCDGVCFYSACEWDGGDCNVSSVSVCMEGCPPSWLGDGYCDSACHNPACNWDDGDCTIDALSRSCAKGCPTDWVGDGFCDSSCFTSACGWDEWDCNVSRGCADGCPPRWLGNDVCEAECNTSACNYDGGDCD